jgi:WD40 repeat protein
MIDASRLVAALAALLVAGAAWAQQPRGWLGAELQDLTREEADKLGWEAPRGVKVTRPHENGPAARAGVLAQDVILSLDGQEVENMSGFLASVATKDVGAKVRLRLLRAGRERTITVALERQPASAALGAQPKKEGDGPILQLDTGGHMAKIQSVAFTPDGRLLVSASDDKVIRVWDWQKGKTVRTMRGQSGPGPAGKIHAMAISPDGRLLAAAGWSDAANATVPCCGDIRLYDFASGEIVALLRGHKSVVNVLNFSPDGSKLVSGSGLGDLSAIVWDVPGRRLMHRLVGHKADLYGAIFTPDGERAVTGSDDATLRLWRVSDGSLIKEMKGHAKDIDRALTVRATDGIIASGDATGEIRLWDGRTGDFLRIFANQGGPVGQLRFSRDGTRLLSTCRYRGCLQKQFLWDMATGKQLFVYTKHDNIVLAANMSPDGELVATGGGSNTAVHVWDLKTGATRHILAGTGAPGWAAGFSKDGRRLGWGHQWGRDNPAQGYGSIRFALTLPASGVSLGRPEKVSEEAAAADFLQARPAHGGNVLAHRKGGTYGYDALLDMSRDGQTQVSIERGPTDGYQHRSYTFTPDGAAIVSGGGNGNLTAYDLKGKVRRKFIGHEGDVWAVTPSPDGRMLVSGSADQTVRLWNLETGELIVTLFHGSDGEWVMWTPQGYYTGSPGSDKLVGWQINRGLDKTADFVGAEQLRQHLNRPDIVEKAIVLASAEAAVRAAPGTSFTLADLLARPVPRFRIASPASGSAERRGRSLVRIEIQSTPDPVKAIRVQVNGRQVEEKTAAIDSGGFGAGEQLLDVPLGRGRNDVRVTLTNATGEKAETIVLTHEGEGALDKRGTLYLLAIGVDKYPGLGANCGSLGTSSCDLNYPGADARAIADAVEKRLGPAHDGVVKRVLVNGAGREGEPTAANILDAIDLLKLAKETDTIVFFIAGHGFNDGPNYRFLPTNAELAGGSLRGSTVVSWHALQEAVETAKGRRILFVDTCHSGNAYNQRLGNAAYHANIIAYTAARFDQEAIEDPRLGHGLFTYAVVEGLRGAGELAARRQLSTRELGDYVIRRVDQLAKALKGEQEPQYFKGRDAEDYVLVRW